MRSLPDPRAPRLPLSGRPPHGNEQRRQVTEMSSVNKPGGNYLPVIIHGGIAYVSGQLPHVVVKTCCTRAKSGRVSISRLQRRPATLCRRSLHCGHQPRNRRRRQDRPGPPAGRIHRLGAWIHSAVASHERCLGPADRTPRRSRSSRPDVHRRRRVAARGSGRAEHDGRCSGVSLSFRDRRGDRRPYFTRYLATAASSHSNPVAGLLARQRKPILDFQPRRQHRVGPVDIFQPMR